MSSDLWNMSRSLSLASLIYILQWIFHQSTLLDRLAGDWWPTESILDTWDVATYHFLPASLECAQTAYYTMDCGILRAGTQLVSSKLQQKKTVFLCHVWRSFFFFYKKEQASLVCSDMFSLWMQQQIFHTAQGQKKMEKHWRQVIKSAPKVTFYEYLFQ